MPGGVFSGESGPPTADAECQVSFCVENPLIPAWASRLGSDAGKPKQSGSMYSALALPKSRRKSRLPYKIWRRMDSAEGELTSLSSIDEPAGNHLPAFTY